jgi:uncharacterized protein YfaT (DUF1175 family)
MRGWRWRACALAVATVVLCRPTAASLVAQAPGGVAPRQLADLADRTAFRQWFTLLADWQFEHPALEVTDCAALIRFAYREALRPHTPEWARRVGLPIAPPFGDVQRGPRPQASGWPLFQVAVSPARFAEFADARTIVGLNARPLGRDVSRLQPGDLLYFQQHGQRQPDHLMVFVGRSQFDVTGHDWVVYHTGPSASDAGEVRKLHLTELLRHPAPRWRPVPGNPRFIGLFRLTLL